MKPLSPQTTHLRSTPGLKALFRAALTEDIGRCDVTTESVIGPSSPGCGRLIAKQAGVFCGRTVAGQIWLLVSPKVKIVWRVDDGEKVRAGQVVADLTGPYRALLTGERVALNFMQRMSGIATLTRKFVEASESGRPAPAICDTRKTTPLWRTLERFAVVMGGGVNHRFGLFDMILLKENHIRAAGGISEAVALCRARHPRLPLAVEVTTEAELREALSTRPGLILLDNMTPRRVSLLMGRYGNYGIPFEVSGGVNLRNIKAYVRSGVHRISIGALTHSAPALDLSLQLYPAETPA